MMLRSIPVNYKFQKNILIDKTLSFCPFCLKLIPAKIVEKNGKIFMEKKCCKDMSILLENDSNFYKKSRLPNRRFFYSLEDLKKIKSMTHMRKEIDLTTSYLTIYTTLDCNLNCPICFLKMEPSCPKTINMPFNHIIKIIKKNKHKLIYLTGGEPTLRDDLPEIIKAVIKNDSTPVLCTNGLKLIDLDYVKKLKDAGLKIVAFSFDSFNDKHYEILRGKKLLLVKMLALKNLKNEGMDVWLIPVIGKDINEDQIGPIIKFACKNTFIKNVAFSPLNLCDNNDEHSATKSDIVKVINKDFKEFNEKIFCETKNFYSNLYNTIIKLLSGTVDEKLIVEKFGYFYGSDVIYFRVKNNKIYPVLKLKSLIEINRVLEKSLAEKSKTKFLLTLIKNIKTFAKPELAFIFLKVLYNRFNLPKALTKMRFLRIGILFLESSFNIDLKEKYFGGAVPERITAAQTSE